MSTKTKKRFADQIECLPPLPAVAQRILAATESTDTSAEDVAKALREDPTIAARILRVANSPFYGAARRITQISRAVTRLGTIAVRNLVLGICASKTLSTHPLGLKEHRQIWHHSIAVASACELIARQIRFRCAEEAFVAGLLHDTGQLAMLILQPEVFRKLLAPDEANRTHLEREAEAFGTDHADVGFQIMTRWGLPETLCHAVRGHHRLSSKVDASAGALGAVLALGDVIALQAGYGLDLLLDNAVRSETARKRLGLSMEDHVGILKSIEARVTQAGEMLDDRKPSPLPMPRTDGGETILWISAYGPDHPHPSKAMIEQREVPVRHVAASDLSEAFSSGSIIILDLDAKDAKTAEAIGAKFLACGARKAVILNDPPAGQPTRQRDAKTGVFHMPRDFTAFDFRWLMEQR